VGIYSRRSICVSDYVCTPMHISGYWLASWSDLRGKPRGGSARCQRYLLLPHSCYCHPYMLHSTCWASHEAACWASHETACWASHETACWASHEADLPALLATAPLMHIFTATHTCCHSGSAQSTASKVSCELQSGLIMTIAQSVVRGNRLSNGHSTRRCLRGRSAHTPLKQACLTTHRG